MADFVIGEKTSVSMKTLFVILSLAVTSIWCIASVSFKAEANSQDIAKMKSDQTKFQHVVIKHLTKLEIAGKVQGPSAAEDFEGNDDEY